MRILVTGSRGFIGRHVAHALRTQAHAVTGVDIRPPGDANGQDEHCDDYTHFIGAVEAGMFDAVIHHAAITNTAVEHSDELHHINVIGVAGLGAACAASSTRFIHASSASIYGQLTDPLRPAEVGDEVERSRCTGPLNAYAASKLAAEQALTATAKLDFLALRYTNVFGVGELPKGITACILSQLVYQAAAGTQLRLFSDTLSAARDFLPVSRVVASIVHALGPCSNAHGIHNLGSGVSVTFSELIGWICAFDADVVREIALIPNPFISRYQYVTRVSQTGTDALLDHTPIRVRDIRDATRRLYEHYQSLPLAQALLNDDWTASAELLVPVAEN